MTMFDPTDFRELTTVEGLVNPTDLAMESAVPEKCPFNGGAVRSGKAMHYICTLIAAEIAESTSCHERICRVCICNGKPSTAENAYLRRHILACAWTLTIQSIQGKEEAPALDHTLRERCEIAAANVKRLAGDVIAKRFVDSLVDERAATPEEAVNILDNLDLLAVRQ